MTNLITSGLYYNYIILSKTLFKLQAPPSPYVLLVPSNSNPIPKPIPTKSHRDTHYQALTLALTQSNLPYSEPEPLS